MLKKILPYWLNLPHTKLKDGYYAEKLAAKFMHRQGYHIVAHNVHCRYGEIDLICHNQVTLVFVEVRLRRSDNFGGAAESINKAKQQRIIRTAEYWLSTQGAQYTHLECRYDAILLKDLNINQIQWILSAF